MRSLASKGFRCEMLYASAHSSCWNVRQPAIPTLIWSLWCIPCGCSVRYLLSWMWHHCFRVLHTFMPMCEARNTCVVESVTSYFRWCMRWWVCISAFAACDQCWSKGWSLTQCFNSWVWVCGFCFSSWFGVSSMHSGFLLFFISHWFQSIDEPQKNATSVASELLAGLSCPSSRLNWQLQMIHSHIAPLPGVYAC